MIRIAPNSNLQNAKHEKHSENLHQVRTFTTQETDSLKSDTSTNETSPLSSETSSKSELERNSQNHSHVQMHLFDHFWWKCDASSTEPGWRVCCRCIRMQVSQFGQGKGHPISPKKESQKWAADHTVVRGAWSPEWDAEMPIASCKSHRRQQRHALLCTTCARCFPKFLLWYIYIIIGLPHKAIITLDDERLCPNRALLV